MKSCGYCGRESADDAAHCPSCGTEFVASETLGVAEPELQADENLSAQSEAAELESDVPPDGEAALCTSCLFANLPEARWCKRCGAPMGSLVGLLFPDASMAAGFVYRKAIERPRKVVEVLGIWLHFFPGFLVSMLALRGVLAMGGGGGMPQFVLLCLAIVCGAYSGTALYQTTGNFFAPRAVDRQFHHVAES